MPILLRNKDIFINDTDYTQYFTKTGYEVEYESVQGDNAGLMLDGSYTEDEIKLRTILTLYCMPLNETQLKNILQEVYSKPYHMVQYYSPKLGLPVIEEMRRTVSKQVYKGFGSDRNAYWTGTVITFTTR